MRENSAGAVGTVQPAVDAKRHAFRAVALFAVTMFIGSGLLFLVQPMFAKLALPRLGGSPSVWNTCVLFFQTTLLLGYLYAHFSTRWLGVRRQVGLHLILLLLPILALPLTLGDSEPPLSANPVWWLLRTMALTVGLPFFVVSTSAPLLQRWFAVLPVPSARDPYFLYSASNLGSMLALLGYPFLLEPLTGTRQQTWTSQMSTIGFQTPIRGRDASRHTGCCWHGTRRHSRPWRADLVGGRLRSVIASGPGPTTIRTSSRY